MTQEGQSARKKENYVVAYLGPENELRTYSTKGFWFQTLNFETGQFEPIHGLVKESDLA